MADEVTIVSGGADVEEAEPLEDAAHAAAVAEGSAQAHGERAAEAAVNAEMAAQEAGAVAASSTAAAIDAMDAAGRAEAAAAEANSAALAVAEAISGFTTAVESWREEMASQRAKPADPEPAKESTTPDKPPATKKKRLGDRYYGR
jgi:hypothetical protein